MPSFVIYTEPTDPRVGVFVADAPTEEEAKKQIFAGQGKIVWSTNKPELDEPLLKSFGPLSQERARAHIKSLAGQFSTSGSVMLNKSLGTRLMEGGIEAGKKMALPVGGSVVGSILGPFVGFPRPLGSALGGGLGEITNQVLGITPRDFEQIWLAAATGMAGKMGAKALPKIGPTVDVSNLAKKLPGAGGAFTEIAGQQLRTMPMSIESGTQQILGNETIDSLYDLAKQGRFTSIPATNLRNMVARGLLTEKNAARFGLQFSGLKRILTKISSETKRGGKALSLQDIDLLRKRIGARIGRMAVDGEERNALRSLYKGIMDDLDAAAETSPNAAALLLANRVARREFAARDLGDFLEQKIFGAPRQDRLQTIRISALKKEIDNMLAGRPSRTFELFEGSLTRLELDEIKNVVDFWAENLPYLPPSPGVQFGSGPTVAAAGVGYVLGGGTGAGAMVTAKHLLTRGLMSRTGREAMVSLIARRQPINLTELGLLMIGTAARQRMQTPNLLERFQGPKLEANR